MFSHPGFHVPDVPDERTAFLARLSVDPFLKYPLDEDVTVAIAIPWPEELDE